MIKRVSLIRRKEGMTKEEFFAYWTGPHADIVRQLPGVRGLRFGIVQSWTPGDVAWDGVGEVWFDSMEDAAKAFATEPYASQLVEDRKQFLGEGQSCYVTEHTVVTPPEGY
ncbi:MAG: EthD family reductase [Rhizobium sp.]|nr:EthD family reductase [Rhizobium sp.]